MIDLDDYIPLDRLYLMETKQDAIYMLMYREPLYPYYDAVITFTYSNN